VYLGGPADATFGRPSSTDIALSPDGSLLVYAGWKSDGKGKVSSQLYRRPLGQEHAEPIPGTEGASSPFFSPDGQSIGFFSGGALKRISPAGGSVQIVTPDAHLLDDPDAGSFAAGASWADDGTIVYGGADGIYRVAGEGGEPRLILADPSDSAGVQPHDSASFASYAQPSLLPGGRTLVVQRWSGGDPKRGEIVAVDVDSGRRTTLMSDALAPLFLEPGHLLFVRRATLMEAGFDARRLQVVGQPRVVMVGVMQAVNTTGGVYETGATQVAVSRSGAMAWVGGGTFPELSMDVFETASDGRARPLRWEPHEYVYLRTSPTGDRVAYSSGPLTHLDVYVRDLARDVTLPPLPTGGYFNVVGAWSPDGTSLLIASDRDGPRLNIYRIPADGSGGSVRLAPSDRYQVPGSWSSKGVIAYLQQSDSGDEDIWTLAPDGKPTPFVATRANEWYPVFSPDGHWLAYVSDAGGQDEVYVRAYPGPGAAIPVSPDGGDAPTWSPTGHRLYYIQGKTTSPVMMVADVVSEDPFRVGRARPLIDPWPYLASYDERSYDVLPDGLFIASKLPFLAGGTGGTRAAARRMYRVDEIHVIVNFGAELNGKTP
jgi:eukaryotic-like serine/threonine-protein kinase